MAAPAPQTHELHAAFRRARLLVILLAAAVLAYMALAALLLAADIEHALEGDRAMLWLLRVVLALGAALNLMMAQRFRLAALEERYQTPARLEGATILASALVEAVAVYGLLLTLLGGQILDCVVFGAVALAALASFLPDRDEWEHRAQLKPLEQQAGDTTFPREAASHAR